MSYLTNDEVKEAFVNVPLEEKYNFLEDDLVKMANAFADKAKPKIAMEERAECVKIVMDLNGLVGQALERYRKNQDAQQNGR